MMLFKNMYSTLRAMTLRRKLLMFMLAGWIVALVYSPFLLSMAMIGLFLLCFIEFSDNNRPFLVVRPTLSIKDHFPRLAWAAFFLVVLLSGWMTEDWSYWWERMRIKAPFLFFPIALLFIQPFKEEELDILRWFLLIILTLTSVGIFINYATNFEPIQQGIKQGRPIPTPRNHIRYSLMCVMGVLAGIRLWDSQNNKKHILCWLSGGMTLFLIISLHVLSVRTGLLALYIMVSVLSFAAILRSKRWILLVGLVAMGIGVPFIAYHTLPSIKAKVDYTKYDYYQFKRGEGALYADAGRLSSLHIGWEIFEAHPMLGVGAGNLRQEVQRRYKARFPKFEVAHMPHNQFLFVAAGTGLLGLSLFLGGLFYPLAERGTRTDLDRIGFYTVLLFVLMLEHTLENSMGVGFSLLFFGLYWHKDQHTP